MQSKSDSTSKCPPKKCLTPRGLGGGDGVRQNVSARKRVPVSSAKKFNARVPNDESLKLKLEDALHEMGYEEEKKLGATKLWTPVKNQEKCLLKSASVAEITPTKAKRRLSARSYEDSCELYATPRPFKELHQKKLCTQERTTCKVYRRLILLAWRRSREAAKITKKLVTKQELQVAQLELQIDVLSKLRIAEGQKREEAQNQSQKLKKALEVLELENSQLIEEAENLQISHDIQRNELKVAKAENNFLSEQSIKMQDLLSKKKAEKELLEEKLRGHDEEISAQKVIIEGLEKKLREADKSLKTSATHYRIKEKKYAQLKCEFRKQLDVNNSMSSQLQSLKDEKLDISLKVDDLELQLNNYIHSCEVLKDVNTELTQEIEDISMELKEEKRHNWLRNTKHFALLSFSALQKIAHVVIPVYLEGRGNF